MRYLILLLLATALYAENAPIARLNDSHFGNSGTPVYDVVDPVTKRRFLVVISEHGVAMIEATPVVVPAPPVVKAPPVTPEAQYWEYARTGSFGPMQSDKGWEVVSKSIMGSQTVFHLRRKNPNYKGPSLEDSLPLEK